MCVLIQTGKRDIRVRDVRLNKSYLRSEKDN